jgi:hypothetical protein
LSWVYIEFIFIDGEPSAYVTLDGTVLSWLRLKDPLSQAAPPLLAF